MGSVCVQFSIVCSDCIYSSVPIVIICPFLLLFLFLKCNTNTFAHTLQSYVKRFSHFEWALHLFEHFSFAMVRTMLAHSVQNLRAGMRARSHAHRNNIFTRTKIFSTRRRTNVMRSLYNLYAENKYRNSSSIRLSSSLRITCEAQKHTCTYTCSHRMHISTSIRAHTYIHSRTQTDTQYNVIGYAIPKG